MTDSVVDEVRAAREAYAARFGFDLVAIGRDLQARERACGRVVLAPPEVQNFTAPKPHTTKQAGGIADGL